MNGVAVFVDSLFRLRCTQSKLFPQYHTKKIHTAFSPYPESLSFPKLTTAESELVNVYTFETGAQESKRFRQTWNRFLGSVIKGLKVWALMLYLTFLVTF
jgi:hypothetical protein